MSETLLSATPEAAATGPAAAGGMEWLPESYRADPAFRDFKDVAGLAKSFKDTQAFTGADKATLLRMPKDDAPPEAWAEFHAKLGRPEAPSGYEIAMPEGFPEERLTAFKDFAHKAGLPQKQAAAVMSFYAEQEAAARTAMAEGTVSALKLEWGQAYDANLHDAKRGLREIGGDEVLAVLESSGLGNHPALIKMFAKLGKGGAEPNGLKGGGAGMPGGPATPGDAAADWAALQKDKEFMGKYIAGDGPATAQVRRLFAAMNPGD